MADHRTEYEIRDTDGRCIAIHVRSDLPGREKSFYWKRDGSKGLKGLKTRDLPLYGTELLASAESSATVYVVEGEKAKDSLQSIGAVAVGTVTGASGTPSSKSLEVLQSRRVVLWPDADGGGRKHMLRIAKCLAQVASRISWIEPDGLPKGGDAFDWIAKRKPAGESAEQILAAVETLEKEPPSEAELLREDERKKTRQSKEQKKPSQAEVLAELASGAELFHTPSGEAFAAIRVDDHRETWPVESNRFERWLRHRFYKKERKAPASQALKDAIATLQAQAHFDGVEIEVSLRVAGDDERILLDLCNENWEVVEITAAGWKVVSDAPITFRRAEGMLELPHPKRGGSIDELRDLANVGSDDDFALIVAFLLAALRPGRPYPLLNVMGEQGSAKSTLQRILRGLIDPSTTSLRSTPKDNRDLAIAAKNAYLVVFDNLSYLKPDLSDALCRLATGGGFATRKLYSDDEEAMFDFKRPVMVNGIADTVVRGDLMSRAINLVLPPIPENQRRTERELEAEIEEATPRILGALLDALSMAIRNLPGLELSRLSRMADFVEWGVAAEPALPWPEGTFLRAYEENCEAAISTALESDPVAVAAQSLMEEQEEFEGTMTELLAALERRVGQKLVASRAWPKSARALSSSILRAAPFLRSVGIELMKLPRQGKRRPYRLARVASDGHSDGRESQYGETVTMESSMAAYVDDGSDGSDGLVPTSSVGSERRDGMPLDDDDDEEIAI